MKKYLIYQHLGLGDHIICNGLIREICKQNNQYYILCKEHNFFSVKGMFRDIKNLEVISLGNNVENKNLIFQFAQNNNADIITIGHDYLNYEINFDKSFYSQFNIDFEKRWSSFFVERDSKREIDLFNKMNITPNDYIFIHEDIDRGMNINHKLINDKKIVKSNISYTNNIIDYLTILENAKEIHCIDSSFLFLIDSFNFKAKLYNHRYARQYPINNTPSLKNAWNILTTNE